MFILGIEDKKKKNIK